MKSTVELTDGTRVPDVELAPNAHGVTWRDTLEDIPGAKREPVQVLVPWHRVAAIYTTEAEVEAERERAREAFADSVKVTELDPDNVRNLPGGGGDE